MPKRPSSVYIARVLINHGFRPVSQKGSHAKFRKGSLNVIVPMGKKEIPVGTFLSIVKQSKLDKNVFLGESAK